MRLEDSTSKDSLAILVKVSLLASADPSTQADSDGKVDFSVESEFTYVIMFLRSSGYILRFKCILNKYTPSA